MKQRDKLRKLQDNVVYKLMATGYELDDRLQGLVRPDGYLYTVLDVKQYIIPQYEGKFREFLGGRKS